MMAVNGSPGHVERVHHVDELRELIRGSSGMVFLDCQALDSAETSELRKAMRPALGRLKVVKNRLMRIACEQENVTGCEAWLKFNTAVAFVGEDSLLAVKAIQRYASAHERLKLKGAFMDGRLLTLDSLKALAALPGRLELLTMMAMTMKAALTRAVRSFSGVYVKLALLLKEAARKTPSA